MFISAAGALTVRHLKTNSPTILNIDLYFIVFSFHSFGFMIMQIILLFLQLFDYNRFLFFPFFHGFVPVDSRTSTNFSDLYPEFRGTLSGADNRVTG
jgi:hypothetical protein